MCIYIVVPLAALAMDLADKRYATAVLPWGNVMDDGRMDVYIYMIVYFELQGVVASLIQTSKHSINYNSNIV